MKRLKWSALAGRSYFVLAVAIAFTLSLPLLSGPVASEETQYHPCTTGDAQALLQALPIATNILRRGQDRPGLVEGLQECQYRLFWDGDTVEFCESDAFLGGVTYIADYKNLGMTQEEAIAALEAYDDRVFIDGQEQQLLRTTYKQFVSIVFGLSIYQHRALILQLPPGDYVSVWQNSHPEEGVIHATVHIHILPDSTCS